MGALPTYPHAESPTTNPPHRPFYCPGTGIGPDLPKGGDMSNSSRVNKPRSDQFPVRVCSCPLCIINRL